MSEPATQILVITDCTDVAAVEIKLALRRELVERGLGAHIEGPVKVLPLNIINGAFLTRLVADLALPGTILMVVLSPSEAPARRVIGKTASGDITFFGRDTGVFAWLAADLGVADLVEPQFDFTPFGGKNTWPAAVAQFIGGSTLNQLGTRVPPNSLAEAGIKTGTIVHVDNFGIAKFYESPTLFNDLGLNPGDRARVTLPGGQEIKALVQPKIVAEPTGTWLVYPGSSLGGLPELACTRKNAAAELGLTVGAQLTVEPW